MTSQPINPLPWTIEQQIVAEEEKYQKSFKADAHFHVLKEIRETIKQLKAQLKAQRASTKEDMEAPFKN